MSVVYAIESSSDALGTLADAYGVYSNPMISAVVAKCEACDSRRPVLALKR